ncbi:MAG TPA: DUF4190 domain-containing protein [Pyrinomonadaceae bacterium]|jgi:hypothetical protein
MKRCPTCQKEFADSMRFCQTDGTPLIDSAEAAQPVDPYKTVVGQPPPDDPFKTVVGGAPEQSKDNDILQLPDEPADPMKTMVVSPGDWKNDQSSSTAGSEPSMPEPPKFNEPDLNPPPFGDLSPQPPSSTGDIFGSGSSASAPPFEPPGEPKISDSPFGQPPSNSPFQSPFEQQKSSFEPPSPFDAPKPPPFKEPESPFGNQQSPFDQSPFGQPQTPLGQAGNDPFSNPSPQAEWNPPPAPVQNWQDQQLGANTPFQPPAVSGSGGQNQTLSIVSLVLGILSLPCCGWYVFGIAAIITGFIAKGKADNDPGNYGGRGMALAGMIMGAISLVLGIIVTIIWLAGGLVGRF